MPLARMSEKYPIFKLPVFRGVGTLAQAMSLGLKALRFSANAQLEAAGRQTKQVGSTAITLNLIFSLVFFIFLYKFVPLYLVTWLEKWFPALEGRILFNAADGLIRLMIFLGFLFLVSRLKDIRRVFEYHG